MSLPVFQRTRCDDERRRALKWTFLDSAFDCIGRGQDVRAAWTGYFEGLELDRRGARRVMVHLGETGTAWWRALIPFLELASDRGFDVRMSTTLTPDDLGWADVLWLQRPGQRTIPEIVGIRRLWGRSRVVVDGDDWLRGVPTYNPFAGRIEQEGVREVFDYMLGEADLVTFSTAELKLLYAPDAGVAEARILPNAIDLELWPDTPTPPAIARLRVGWAGSPTHSADLAMIEPALLELMRRRAHVEFVRIGAWGLHTAGELRSLPRDRIIEYGFEPHSHRLPKYVRGLDLAIAPLVDSPFNRAKSNCKWLEYSAAGVATVASDLAPYQGLRSIALASPKWEDWAQALEILVDQPETRYQLAKMARVEVEREWTIRRRVHLWKEAIATAMD